MKQFFKLAELPLEAHVWKNDRSSLASKLERLLEAHVFLLHEVGNDAAGTSRDASIAVDQHTALAHAFPDKANCCREVPNERRV